jgi:hypothetical protein
MSHCPIHSLFRPLFRETGKSQSGYPIIKPKSCRIHSDTGVQQGNVTSSLSALILKPSDFLAGTCTKNFFVIFRYGVLSLILPVALGPGVYSASNRNEYRKH